MNDFQKEVMEYSIALEKVLRQSNVLHIIYNRIILVNKKETIEKLSCYRLRNWLKTNYFYLYP